MNLSNLNLQNLNPRNRQPGAALLGLAFDGSRIDGVAVRRVNGSVEMKHAFSAVLALDPLTNDAEIAGREIRKLLDEHGVKDRWCTVCLPLNWALTLNLKLPTLPEEDIASYLQLEAERGFPYSPDALLSATSRYQTPSGDAWATVIAMPRNSVVRLEAVLAAAQLRVASFSIGITVLQPAGGSADGVLAFVPGEGNIRMQLTLGGGVAVLRTIEGAFELEGTERLLQADHVLREVRITLGQLAPELRAAVHRIRVFGKSDDADELAEALLPRLREQGLSVEQMRVHAPDEFGIKLPVNTPASAALSLAMRHLAGSRGTLEFLPPKISAWQQFTSKYSSPKLVTIGATAGAVVAAVVLAFFVQQVMLWYRGHQWNNISKRVYELEDMQAKIRQFRPWYDGSFRELSILRRLTESLPEDGSVSAKVIEIRDPNKPGESPLITCTGTARDNPALLKALDKLRAAKGVVGVRVEQIRGRSPQEFTFNFHWSEGGP